MQQQSSIPTDIIRQAARGNRQAQSRLYEQYSQAMYNICVRMTGHPQTAKDVLQEAFILAFKNLGQLNKAEQFGGWLRRIVINECIRFGKRSPGWLELDDTINVLLEEEEPAWWTTVSLDMVHQAIKALPEGSRQVFVLYVLEDYSHKEIAAQLGISESTSKSQYQRARKLLKEQLLKKC